ncbi:MAG: potassium transporter TrkA, partial [Planctomycetia bacterium]|nr:potassium transporter TrkA [Planctomycetia bacterium]
MFAIASLLVIIALSLVIVRVATVALTLTGLSDDLARFQAYSAFTGVGFTTSESEHVARGRVRRRIICPVMLV